MAAFLHGPKEGQTSEVTSSPHCILRGSTALPGIRTKGLRHLARWEQLLASPNLAMLADAKKPDFKNLGDILPLHCDSPTGLENYAAQTKPGSISNSSNRSGGSSIAGHTRNRAGGGGGGSCSHLYHTV